MRRYRVLIFVLYAFASSCLFAQNKQQIHNGKSERVKVFGQSLVGNFSGDSPDRHVSIYLPPTYDVEPNRRYPVVYFLHGFTSSDEAWFGLTEEYFVNLPLVADKVFAAGVQDMIIVMPNALTGFGGSMFSNSVTTGDWESYVAEDLVTYIDSHYRTISQRTSRGIAGHSMGGYGAIRIGMKYPGVFSSMYSLSPCCMEANLNPQTQPAIEEESIQSMEEAAKANFMVKAVLASAAAWSPNPKNPPFFFDLPLRDGEPQPDVIAKWAANASLIMIHQYVPSLKKYRAIAVDAGNEDMPIADTVRELDKILNNYGINHFFEIYEGDHMNRIAVRLESVVLPWFSKILTFSHHE